MNATMMVAGYLWTGIICLVLAAICLDYTRRWWKGRQEAKGYTWRMKNGGSIAWSKPERPDEWCGSDFPSPMGAAGYIKESRFRIEAESDAEAITQLIARTK